MIEFEEFERIINYLKEYEDKTNRVEDIVSTINRDFPPVSMFGFASGHEKIIVSLLNNMFNLNSDDFIGTVLEYWIYDLKFGEKWTKDSIRDSNKETVEIKTIRQLYDFLIQGR